MTTAQRDTREFLERSKDRIESLTLSEVSVCERMLRRWALNGRYRSYSVNHGWMSITIDVSDEENDVHQSFSNCDNVKSFYYNELASDERSKLKQYQKIA